MAIKEYKQFFLRDAQDNSSAFKDQEVGFPIEYTINTPGGGTVTVKNRFLTGHYPSKEVFEKLYDSLTFKLNVSDTASLTNQGLVKIGTSTQLNALADVDSDGFVLTYKISELSPFIDGKILLSGLTYSESNRTLNFEYKDGSADTLLNVYTSIFTDSYTGGVSGVPSALGSNFDMTVDKSANNSLYLRDASGSWTDTGVDLASAIRITDTLSGGNINYKVEQEINGVWSTIKTIVTSDGSYTDFAETATDVTISWKTSLGATLDSITFDKNTEVVAQLNPSGTTTLYNGSVSPANKIADIPASSTSTTSQVIYGTGVPSGSLGDDNDTFIDTDSGKLYLNSSGVWNEKVCFSKCSPSSDYLFRATGSSFVDVTSAGVGNSISNTPGHLFNITADDTLGTDNSYDPDNVWQGSNYTKVSATGSDDHILYVTGQIKSTGLTDYYNDGGTFVPIEYNILISAIDDAGAIIGSKNVQFFADGVACGINGSSVSTVASTTTDFDISINTNSYDNPTSSANLINIAGMFYKDPVICSGSHIATVSDFGTKREIKATLISNVLS